MAAATAADLPTASGILRLLIMLFSDLSNQFPVRWVQSAGPISPSGVILFLGEQGSSHRNA
jgi:hypothetical protein